MATFGNSGPPRGDEPPTLAASDASGPDRAAPRGPAFSAGEVLAGRFRILRFIAQGGMGEVYEAEDQVLRDRVALKTIRSHVAADAGTMERFLREVQLARRVTHPNVSRIFDVFQQGETKFLTMELLSGETLADRIARSGRLTPAQALPLVSQMAAGLAAAHAAGVIHRDFKSGNVMLLPDPRAGGERAVVADFGLARRHGSSGTSFAVTAARTEADAVVGTPDYMAPEQVEGGEITPAADIYALGIVLYEMVTGDRPFPGESPITVALRRLREKPPSPRARVPDLDPSWETAILRCLERNPADRYESAGDVVRALGGETVAPSRRQRRRSRAIGLGIAAAGVAAGAAIFFAARAGRGPEGSARPLPARAARPAVAVLGFRNLSGRPEEAWLSTALSEMLTTELAAGEKLRAIPSEDVARMKIDLSLPEADTLSRDTLARVRRHSGADLVLVGSYLVLDRTGGAPVRLDLRLQDAAGGETLAVVSEKGPGAELDVLAGRAGAQLRERLRLGAASPDDVAAVKASLPGNPEAARLYAEGLSRLRVFDATAARDLLEKAIAADPGRALPHAALAAAWSDLGYDAKALEHARRAFDLSASLSRETRLLVEARYREMANDWPRAVEIYRSLFTFFPDNLEYGLHLARTQARAGKGKEALGTIAGLRKAFGSEDARIDLAESVTALEMSDYQRMEAAAGRAASLGQKQGARLLVATADLNRAIARRNLGDVPSSLATSEEARALFEAAGDRSGAASALNNIGNSHYDLGEFPQARKAYEGVLAICRETGNQRSAASALDNIASVVGDQGDLKTARALSDQALEIYREIGDKAGQSRVLGNIAAGLVVGGGFREARPLFEQALALYRETGDQTGLAITQNNLGEMLAAQCEIAGAKHQFEQSYAIFRDTGQKSKAVYPAVGLAGVLFEAGDLEGARKLLDPALADCREAGDRHEEAYVLSSQAVVALARGELSQARRLFAEALAIREKIGERGAAELSRLDLARLDLEEGRSEEAARAAGAAAEELARQKLPDEEASALSLYARALAAMGRPAEASRALSRARPGAAASQRETVRRDYRLAAAVVAAARGDSASARRTLRDSIARSQEMGLVAAALEARLALGRVERKAGSGRDADALLASLEKDAAARGFRQIASEAARARG